MAVHTAWFVSDLVRIHIVGFLTLRLIYCYRPYCYCDFNAYIHQRCKIITAVCTSILEGWNESFTNMYNAFTARTVNEPRRQKTGLRGFRPCPTQTGLYSHRRWLETWNFGFRKQRDCTIEVAKTKALISFAVTAKLICVFVFAHVKSEVFSRRGSNYDGLNSSRKI